MGNIHKLLVLCNQLWTLTITEEPIPNQGPIIDLQVIIISIKLGLNFEHAITNSAMTHVLVLSAKVKRSEQLK
jgi:hypothetical protein